MKTWFSRTHRLHLQGRFAADRRTRRSLTLSGSVDGSPLPASTWIRPKTAILIPPCVSRTAEGRRLRKDAGRALDIGRDHGKAGPGGESFQDIQAVIEFVVPEAQQPSSPRRL